MVSISDIESGRYHWETANSHAYNAETANDFIENELPENIEVYFQDGIYIRRREVIFCYSIWGW